MTNQENNSNFNIDMIKGLAALTIGVILIALAYKIILQILFFFCGLFLFYYGLTMLKMEQVKIAIDKTLQTIKEHLPKINIK